MECTGSDPTPTGGPPRTRSLSGSSVPLFFLANFRNRATWRRHFPDGGVFSVPTQRSLIRADRTIAPRKSPKATQVSIAMQQLALHCKISLDSQAIVSLNQK
jgi:hypothetical protein